MLPNPIFDGLNTVFSYGFVELAASLDAPLGGVVVGDVAEGEDGFGKCDADFSFAGGNEMGAGVAQSGGIAEMSAAGEDVEVGIDLKSVLDDIRGIVDIGAQNESFGC